MSRTSDLRRLTLVVAFIVAAGALAFGLWHVVIGGLVNGNPRAAAFGVVLATGAASALLSAVSLRQRTGS
jgi:hypothetical protein